MIIYFCSDIFLADDTVKLKTLAVLFSKKCRETILPLFLPDTLIVLRAYFSPEDDYSNWSKFGESCSSGLQSTPTSKYHVLCNKACSLTYMYRIIIGYRPN